MWKQIEKKPLHTNPTLNQNRKKTIATLRLQKDILAYDQEKIQFVQLNFPDKTSIQTIKVLIRPQENSIYKSTCVEFELNFPDSYPMDAPKLKCLNRIYHPNINYNGSVCLPLVREDYSPTVNLTSIICGLIFIMTYPNAEDALMPDIGDLMIKDKTMFQKIVEYTSKGKVFKNQEYDNIHL